MTEILKEGLVIKKIETSNVWKERWAKCTRQTFIFGRVADKTAIGTIELRGCTIEPGSVKPNCFVVSYGKNNYLFAAPTGPEMLDWITILRNSVKDLELLPDTLSKEEKEKYVMI